jgi:hypothetical protein
MLRRELIKTLPVSITGSVFSVSSLNLKGANDTSKSKIDPDYFLLDRSWVKTSIASEVLSSEGFKDSQVILVGGDVTDFWRKELGSGKKELPETLVGVTEESFYFCLKRLMATSSNHSLETQIALLKNGLYNWIISIV